MHWVIQENLYDEKGLRELIETLDRFSIPYSTHKVVPFSGELIPDVNPEGPIVCIGAYSMIRIAKARGWTPGVWSNDNFDFKVWNADWGSLCLNHDAKVHRFADVPKQAEFFMRPTMDSKAFAGAIFEWEEYQEWRRRVVELKEDDGSTLTGDTPVLVCSPKEIYREIRLWIVDRKVVTASQYKEGNRVYYRGLVDYEAIQFGEQICQMWQPDRAYVLDIALTPDSDFKVIEINSLNAAGLYAANVGKLVQAIEEMGYE